MSKFNTDWMSTEELVKKLETENLSGHLKEVIQKLIKVREEDKTVLFRVRTKPSWDAKHPWGNWEVTSEESVLDYVKANLNIHDWIYGIQIWEIV